MKLRLDDFNREILPATGRCSICVPVSWNTSTVLGYEVSRRCKMWKNLTWKSVVIDECPDYQYLHVSWSDKDNEELTYRVRPKYKTRDNLVIGDMILVIKEVSVAGFWDPCHQTI